MVSPAPLATANSPLSYAERAKKAQNTRSSQIAQQRSISQSTSSNAVSSAASTAPSPATVRPTSHTSPTALQATPPSHLTGDVRSAAASHPLPAPSSQSAVPPTADPLIETKVNGDVKPNGDSASVPSASSVQNQASAPPVNVWVIRKEQMATRGQSRSTNSSSSLSQTSAGALVPSQSSGPILPKPIGSNTSPSLTPTLRPSVSAPAMNTNLISPNDYDDPFVRVGQKWGKQQQLHRM
ncbi:hypothetical protein BC628DRAFT_1418682 [Trametes gibbosa]|nr:hypothetical protein BC628DRAFT_1418682 [Trametes gibbosa]